MTARKTLLAVLSMGALSMFAAACGSSDPEVIDVLFYGDGFANHAGQQVSVHTEGETHVATINSSGNFFAGTWIDLERGSTLTVNYYVDANASSTCDASDPVWTVEREANATTSNQAVILPLTYDSAFNPAACSSF